MSRKLKRDDAYSRGIIAAASLVEEFDRHVNHPWRLSDCILFKLNLINRRQVRKNRRPGSK